MWFVVHVKPGTEAQAVEMLKSTSKSDGLEEVFCPMAECLHNEHGRIVEALEPMMDGCVFAVAPSKWELRACLRRAGGLDGLLARHPGFEALRAGEEDFVNRWAAPGERVVAQSEGVVDESGWMTIAGGPLLGREGEVRKRSGKRRWAYLDATVAGEPVTARVGVRITRIDGSQPWGRPGCEGEPPRRGPEGVSAMAGAGGG